MAGCGPHCDNCEFAATSQVCNNLLGEGPEKDVEVMFVGQNPARAEEQALRPLVGETGHLFEELLVETGLIRAQVRVTNAVRCLPTPGSDAVLKHIKACRPWLHQEIQQCQPKVIVVLGATALQSVLGTAGISDLRGRCFKVSEMGLKPDWVTPDYDPLIFCMYMPAMLFRRWEDYPIVIEDFRKLGRVLRGEFYEGELGDYRVLKTVEEVKEIFSYLMEQPRVAFDLETTSYDFWDFNLRDDCNILCASFSAYPGTGFVVPFLKQHAVPFWGIPDWPAVRGVLQEFFKSDTPKWAQNGMFDINFLRANKFEFNMDSFTFDTMLAHHTLQENIAHSLDTLCSLYTHMPLYSYELKKWQLENHAIATYADFPDEFLWPYAAADADATIRVGDTLEAQLRREMTSKWKNGIMEPIPLMEFFQEMVMPLNYALVDMRWRGIVVDVDYMMKLQKEEVQKEAACIEECHRLIGRKFNLRSTKQLQSVLFNPQKPPDDPTWDGNGYNGKPYEPGFGLPIIERTPKGFPSTGAGVLDRLFAQTKHPLLEQMLKVRKCQKKISTYLAGKDNESGMLKRVVSTTGRIHWDFKQHTVVTGRLASGIHTIPNPEKDPEYATLRHIFTVPEGWWMLQCDYSQLELRIVATIAQEATMLQAFAEGKDVHRWAASEINRIPYEEVTPALRKKAKDTQFGIIYGKGPYSLAQDLGISTEEAVAFLEQYFNRFKGLARYFKRQKDALNGRGETSNNFGRKRRLYGYHFLSEAAVRRLGGGDEFARRCRMQRAEMERQIVNFGVQSTGSDLLSRVTAGTRQEYRKREMQSGIIISHHDALYVETPTEELYEAAWILVSTMEAPVPELGNASFPVDLHVGTRWGETHEEATKMVADYIQSRRQNGG